MILISLRRSDPSQVQAQQCLRIKAESDLFGLDVNCMIIII